MRSSSYECREESSAPTFIETQALGLATNYLLAIRSKRVLDLQRRAVEGVAKVLFSNALEFEKNTPSGDL